MSEIIDDFWNKNGTIQKVGNALGSAEAVNKSEGFGRFGAIGSLIKSIMSFFA